MRRKSTQSKTDLAENDSIEQRIDEVEWCSLKDVPRRLKFPFHVNVVGWIVVGAGTYHGVHHGWGTEFCIRLASSDTEARDRVGGRLYRMPFPHVLVKRPGEMHEQRYGGWREAFYIVYPPGMENLLRRAGVDDGPGSLPVWPLLGAPDVLESIREMRRLFPRHLEPEVADELDARCWALVTRLVALRDHPVAHSGQTQAFDTPPLSDSERLRAFSASLPARCLKPVDFVEEARALGLSRSVFYRRFTALVGEPPERHLANLRLDAAARLLRESPLSIKQIAFAVHDKSQSHFAAAFKARFGVTPRNWRDGRGQRDGQDKN